MGEGSRFGLLLLRVLVYVCAIVANLSGAPSDRVLEPYRAFLAKNNLLCNVRICRVLLRKLENLLGRKE